MNCKAVYTRKYQTRKGPPYHAKDCKGHIKRGNDGKEYISKPDTNGVYKWVLKANTTRKTRMRQYEIHDNGSSPFIVYVYPNHIEIYTTQYENYIGKTSFAKNGELHYKTQDNGYIKILHNKINVLPLYPKQINMEIVQCDNVKYYRIIDGNNQIDLLVNQDEDNFIFMFKNGEPLDVRLWDYYITIFKEKHI